MPGCGLWGSCRAPISMPLGDAVRGFAENGGRRGPAPRKAGEIFSAWVGSCLAMLLHRAAGTLRHGAAPGFPLLISSFRGVHGAGLGAIPARWHSRATSWAGVSCRRSWASRASCSPASGWPACLACYAIALMRHQTTPPSGECLPAHRGHGRGGGVHPARLSVRLRAVPARGADPCSPSHIMKQHPRGGAILVVVGRPSGSKEAAGSEGAERRPEWQRQEGGDSGL